MQATSQFPHFLRIKSFCLKKPRIEAPTPHAKMDLSCFVETLSEALSQIDEVRQRAELEYNNFLKSYPSIAIKFNIQTVLSQSKTTIKAFSLILLYHIFEAPNKDFIMSLPTDIHGLITSSIPLFFSIEDLCREKADLVSFSVAAIASFYLSQSLMPDFLNTLLDCSSSSYIPLDCFSQCIKRSSSSSFSIEKLLSILSTGLSGSSTPLFAISSLRVLYSVADIKIIQFDQFVTLIAQLILSFPEPQIFSSMCDLHLFIAVHSQLFVQCSEPILEALIQVSMSSSHQEKCRLRAIDTLTLLIRRLPDDSSPYVTEVVSALLQIECEVPEQFYELSEDDLEISGFASFQYGNLLKIPVLTGPIVEVTLPLIESLLSRPQWQCAHAALTTIEQIVMCAGSAFEVPALVSLLLQFITHPSPQCRCAAFSAFAQASQTYPDLVEYSDTVFSTFIEAISSENYIPSRTNAILALSMYCSHCGVAIIMKYCSIALQKILPLSEMPNPKLQSSILRLINVFASIVQDELAPFYPEMMQWVFTILQTKFGAEYSSLRARAIEAVAFMGACVEEDVFAPNASEFLNLCLQWNWTMLTGEEFEHLTLSLMRICQLAPNQFAECIPKIAERLEGLASKPPSSIVHQPFATDLNPTMDRLAILYDRSVLVEYSLYDISVIKHAIMAIDGISKAIGAQFEQYAERMESAIMHICQQTYDGTTQILALQCLGNFGKIFNANNLNLSRDFDFRLSSILISMLSGESEPSVLNAVLRVLKDSFSRLIESGLMTHIEASSFLGRINIEDPSLDRQIGAIFRIFFKAFPEITRQFFCEKLEKSLVLDKDHPRILSMVVWTEYFRLFERENEHVLSDLLLCVQNGIGDNDYTVSQTGFICLGYLVETGKLDEESIGESLGVILSSLSELSERFPESKEAIDGGIVALTFLLRSGCELSDRDRCLETWFECMPLTSEIDEAALVYDFFCETGEELIQRGAKDAILGKILATIATVSENGIVGKDVKERFKQLLSEIREDGRYSEAVQSEVAKMSFERRKKLNKLY